MKILIVDTSIDGHHISYMNMITKDLPDVYYVLPSKLDFISDRTFVNSFTGKKMLDIIGYLKWIKYINKVIKDNKIDIVHFIYSDDIYRFCGIGIGRIRKKCPIIATQHHLRISRLRKIFIKLFSSRVSKFIVHTDCIKDDLIDIGIKNIVHIEYPVTNIIDQKTKKDACNYWRVPSRVPVFAALGGTRKDKGLDFLLEALQEIQQDFYLLIIGKEQDITLEMIESRILNYKEKVKIKLEEVSDEEFGWAVDASDCIILPYRYSFNGASGPLVEGVWRDKVIIGPSHGSVGTTISTHQLGYTFKSEDINSLRETISEYLESFSEDIVANNEYKLYKESLYPSTFRQHYYDLLYNLTLKSRRNKNV